MHIAYCILRSELRSKVVVARTTCIICIYDTVCLIVYVVNIQFPGSVRELHVMVKITRCFVYR